jgi:hypothetical protein
VNIDSRFSGGEPEIEMPLVILRKSRVSIVMDRKIDWSEVKRKWGRHVGGNGQI